jgi:glutathione synthase/RimK-type ligase-like ATP-grasp enzyme
VWVVHPAAIVSQRVALVTCAELPDGDPDDAPLPAAFGGAPWVVWDDPAVDWDAFDVVLVRSTWDYHDRRDDFLAWADRVGDRLVNPPDVLRDNTDKRYLARLPRTVPTTILEPGDALAPFDREVVVKPTVSAGSRLTARFSPDEHDRAAALVRRIHAAGKAAMVQPYLRSVDARGETALLHFGGMFSHAVRKGPILQPGHEPTGELFAAEELELAREVLATLGREVAYARVDVVEGDDGEPLLLELELTEPSLFFAQADDGAVERFAAAVLRAAGA